MLRSLFSGVSGLRGHQVMMDVVGNNIANVNTAGFKTSSAVFQDLLSQILSGAGAPNNDNGNGGTNPMQIGLGSRVAGITTSFTQGALQVTGRSTDIAIQGDGFLVVSVGGQQMYTRAGNLAFDANGNLVTVDGGMVQGWSADPITRTIDTTGPIGSLTMPPGQLLAPVNTSTVRLGNMLSANAAVNDTVTTGITVYDTQGIGNDLKFTWTKTGTNAWTCAAEDGGGTALGSCALTFNPATGLMATQTPATWTISPLPAANWPNPVTIDFGDPNVDADALKEFGGQSSASAVNQDGSTAGTLQSFKVSNDGVITGVFSNGRSQAVGQLALALFNNPSGLEKAGSSMYLVTPNSGVALVGTAATGGRGTFAAGSLEMSNVDLAAEFTNLIVAQRGFQANSKVITSSDELLQDLLSLKR